MEFIKQQTQQNWDNSQHLVSLHRFLGHHRSQQKRLATTAHHALGGCIVKGVPDLWKKSLSMAEFTGMIFGIYRVFKRGNVFFIH